jgi:hypothetical protein
LLFVSTFLTPTDSNQEEGAPMVQPLDAQNCDSVMKQQHMRLTACDTHQLPLVFFGLNFASQCCEDSAEVSKSKAVITGAEFEEDQKPSAPSIAATDCLRART